MIKRFLYSFCVLILLVSSVFAQDFTAVIPYKVTGGKMVCDFIINGKIVPMIFDTGGKSSVSSSLKEEFRLAVVTSQAVIDANNNKQMMDIVKVDRLSTKDGKAMFNNVPVLVVEDNLLSCFGGSQGIIGSDLFQKCTIEIDDKAKIIRIAEGGMLSITNRQMISFSDQANGMPVIPVGIGRYNGLDVLFDTGSPDFLLLNTYKGLEESGALRVIRSGTSLGSFSVNGQAASGKRILVQIPELFIGRQQFPDLKSSFGDSPYPLLGLELLTYGKVTIDYVNKVFYFEPYQTAAVSSNHQYWDIEMTVKNNQLVVATVWDDLNAGVRVGDVITHINKEPIMPVTFCESITTGLPILKSKNKVVLTVQTADGVKELIINKN